MAGEAMIVVAAMNDASPLVGAIVLNCKQHRRFASGILLNQRELTAAERGVQQERGGGECREDCLHNFTRLTPSLV
jgi:hypothetical protein